MFAPVSVCVPPPCTAKPPLPAIVPPNTPPAGPATVSVLPPRFTVEPAVPDNALAVCGVVAPPTSSVAPLPASVSALPADRLPLPPTASVLPVPIVVLPVYVFAP
ncbi:hypothetical protein DN543_31095, partial [Burkholderia multivorans]